MADEKKEDKDKWKDMSFSSTSSSKSSEETSEDDKIFSDEEIENMVKSAETTMKEVRAGSFNMLVLGEDGTGNKQIF